MRIMSFIFCVFLNNLVKNGLFGSNQRQRAFYILATPQLANFKMIKKPVYFQCMQIGDDVRKLNFSFFSLCVGSHSWKVVNVNVLLHVPHLTNRGQTRGESEPLHVFVPSCSNFPFAFC